MMVASGAMNVAEAILMGVVETCDGSYVVCLEEDLKTVETVLYRWMDTRAGVITVRWSLCGRTWSG